MAEVALDVRWPDVSQQWAHYPRPWSGVVTAGARHPVAEFVALTREATGEAGRRRGTASRARAAATLETTAARFRP